MCRASHPRHAGAGRDARPPDGPNIERGGFVDRHEPKEDPVLPCHPHPCSPRCCWPPHGAGRPVDHLSPSPTLPSDTLQANFAPRSAAGPMPELAPTLPSDTLEATQPVDSFPDRTVPRRRRRRTGPNSEASDDAAGQRRPATSELDPDDRRRRTDAGGAGAAGCEQSVPAAAWRRAQPHPGRTGRVLRSDRSVVRHRRMTSLVASAAVVRRPLPSASPTPPPDPRRPEPRYEACPSPLEHADLAGPPAPARAARA